MIGRTCLSKHMTQNEIERTTDAETHSAKHIPFYIIGCNVLLNQGMVHVPWIPVMTPPDVDLELLKVLLKKKHIKPVITVKQQSHKFIQHIWAAADGGTLHLIPDHLDNVLGSASPRSAQLNFPYYCGSQMENLSSKCKNQSLGKSSNPVKVLDFTVPESTYDRKTMFLEDMSTPECHQAFDIAFGWDTCLNNEEWLRRCILFGLDDFTENDSVLGLVERDLPVMGNENSKSLLLKQVRNLMAKGIPGRRLIQVNCCWTWTVESSGRGLIKEEHKQGLIMSKGTLNESKGDHTLLSPPAPQGFHSPHFYPPRPRPRPRRHVPPPPPDAGDNGDYSPPSPDPPETQPSPDYSPSSPDPPEFPPPYHPLP
ncbi:hypothetical protein J5N97_023201 [Dioscorea zingiberensis]|uniref:Uncharacterized protein n=1 Tax=Dioscorea zingiberensis TaxID=325984 RepID=A0A9D5HBC1_9LILI|nr:hypothetical protein J5N97_023201 [Dioscorea zingiberensis]